MKKSALSDRFTQFGLSETTIEALIDKGFEEPTVVQEKCVPLIMNNNKDLVAQAQTGTGKTAAFGLPLIELLKEKQKHVQALILSPTRELVIQISEEINSLRGKKNLHITPIYGGQSIYQQIKRLEHGVDIVVGTPGRVIDHLKRGTLQLTKISFLVLDEADEMLNMGFLEDVEEILSRANSDRRTLLFSATMPPNILSLSKNYMREHDIVKTKNVQLTTHLTDQIYFEVSPSDKFEALCRIIDMEEDFYGLIFCRTKKDTDIICNKLSDRGYEADPLHGDISQSMREKSLNRFKQKRINILVATDVASRGIDIQNLTHVINYSLPQDPESYVHRIGRTGRAGKEGTAITFVTPDEYRRLMFIKKMSKTDIRSEKLPDVKDLINTKKTRLKTELTNIMNNGVSEQHKALADELLQLHPPAEVLSALLKYVFPEELDEKSYNEIKSVNVDQKGKTRLFVGLGKRDGMTAKSLVNMIKKQSGIEDRYIKEVKVFDVYSFISAPFKQAELILQAFKKKKGEKRTIIERAKK